MIDLAAIRRAKILIVDDVSDNVELLTELLRFNGFSNVHATSAAQEVLPLHTREHYDLILLDIQMPVMNGFEVMAQLRESKIDAYLPVIAITAHHGFKLEVLEAGARDYIGKPFDPVEVIHRIQNALEVRLLHRQLETLGRVHQARALHDALTGLPNRRQLHSRIAEIMTHDLDAPPCSAVLYLDLDGFKAVNDTFGHDAGDALLKSVAQRLNETIADFPDLACLPARIGGDEFVVLVSGLADTHAVDAIATALTEVIAQPYLHGADMLTVSTSIGIAFAQNDGGDVDALLRRADEALYEAKQAGKNCYRIAPARTPENRKTVR